LVKTGIVTPNIPFSNSARTRCVHAIGQHYFPIEIAAAALGSSQRASSGTAVPSSFTLKDEDISDGLDLDIFQPEAGQFCRNYEVVVALLNLHRRRPRRGVPWG
jgi:hypothetical protein